MIRRTIWVELVGIVLAIPLFVCAKTVTVDVSEWTTVSNGVTASGWTVGGLDNYKDGSVRFDSNDDFALSPVYSGFVTQLTMRVKSSSTSVSRILTISPDDSDGATVHAAVPTEKDHFENETFAWEVSEGVRRFRLHNEGSGSAAGWGVASLTVFTDGPEAPVGLWDDPLYRDAFLAGWDGTPGSERYQVRYASVTRVLPRFETVAAWDFSSLTNTSGNTTDLRKLNLPESLSGISGTNVCMQGHASGHVQIGKSDRLGCLFLPMPVLPGGAENLTGILRAWKYPENGKPTMPVFSVKDGVANDLATLELTNEDAEYRFPIPDGFSADGILLSSATNGIALAKPNGRVRVRSFAIVSDYVAGSVRTNGFGLVGSAASSVVVKGLSADEWVWSVRAFDAKGADSAWSPFRTVTLDASKPPLVPPGTLLFLR